MEEGGTQKQPITRDDSITRQQLKNEIQEYADKLKKAKEEIEKVIRGQDQLVQSILRGFIGRGNILLEGLPGLGKTVLCRTFAEICSLDFKRVQFTTDLLPSDIIGIQTYDKERGFAIQKGPIFSNLLLGDEINRAPPKVQSALLEAMGEKQVTIGKETYLLEDPFMVMATQNPVEQSGTFPLPEAQMDRFMFKVNVNYPDYDAELEIIDSNLSSKDFKEFDIQNTLSKYEIVIIQKLRSRIHAETKIKNYILDLVNATRNPKDAGIKNAELINMGASPRASIALLMGAKSEALMQGRDYVTPADVKNVIHEVLRHRLYLNFKAKMQNITADDIITQIINTIKIY